MCDLVEVLLLAVVVLLELAVVLLVLAVALLMPPLVGNGDTICTRY